MQQAMKNLFYVPRYRGHTILHPVRAKYGRVTVAAWPLASSAGRGRGVRASRLMGSICRLAGLENVGVKAHGSRCARNGVKALLSALEGQATLGQLARALPPGARVRELAPGMRRKCGLPFFGFTPKLPLLYFAGGHDCHDESGRRAPGDRLRQLPGEWWREAQAPAPGLRRLPLQLPPPPDPAVLRELADLDTGPTF
jgi:hypothetical protein